MGFLRRNLAFASRNTKEVVYKTLVHPQLEYAAPLGIGGRGAEDGCQLDLQAMEEFK